MERQGHDPREWRVQEREDIARFFASVKKHVVYFAGYGELGYEQLDAFEAAAARVLDEHPVNEVLVHAGTLLRVGGHNGIAEIYRLAHARGIETTGIHPSVAMEFGDTHVVSPYCDHVFFVRDETWGGFLPDGALSPTLALHLDVSDELVMIGGGKHAADELRAFVAYGKRVRYFPAEMNYAFTREWAARAGVDVGEMHGAARDAWDEITSSS